MSLENAPDEVKLAVDADAPCLDVACEVPGCHDGRSGA